MTFDAGRTFSFNIGIAAASQQGAFAENTLVGIDQVEIIDHKIGSADVFGLELLNGGFSHPVRQRLV